MSRAGAGLKGDKPPIRLNVVGVAIGALSVTATCLSYLFPKITSWVAVAGIAGLVVCICLLFWGRIRYFLRSLHPAFQAFVPWAVMLILILTLLLTCLALSDVDLRRGTSVVTFDRARGAVFNSWADQGRESGHIRAFGGQAENETLMWAIDESGAASFSFKVDQNQEVTDPRGSSGGYMTFYDRPRDRLSCERFSFKCKVTDGRGVPDLGIRIAVDAPKLTGRDRELVTYEIPSLNDYLRGQQRLEERWQEFTLDIGDFIQNLNRAPLPEQVDANTINKVVFFITEEMAEDFTQGTLWFSDVAFH